MGYKYTGDSVFGVSLTVNTPKPLDIRTVVENTTELYNIPKNTAYKGMTVANIANGNIYMLVGDLMNPTSPVDPSKPQQWKASYESILILSCTLDEYKTWEENTGEGYVPINPDLPHIYENVYYYIYEDSIPRSEIGDENYENPDELQNQAYVSYALLMELDKRVSSKANSSDVQSLDAKVINLESDLLINYTKTEDLIKNYASLLYINELIDLKNEQSFVSTILKQYYTSDEIDAKNFISLDDLKGETTETDYIFVTQSEYKETIGEITSELNSTLKTEEDGSVKKLTVETLVSSLENLIVDTNELYIGENKVAIASEVPKIITLEKSKYDELVDSEKVEEETYYCIYSDEQKDGVITNDILTSGYYSKAQVNQAIYDALKPLVQRIAKLEGASAILNLGVLNEITLG